VKEFMQWRHRCNNAFFLNVYDSQRTEQSDRGVANFMENLLNYMESRQGVTRDTKAKKELALIPCQARQ